jgi:hypothetical protein
MGQCKLEWATKTTNTEELADTLNWFELNGYEVDRYDKLVDHYEYIKWIVVGWKPREGW